MNTGHRGNLEVVAIGDELGLISPQEPIDRLQTREGDTLYLEPTATGFLPRISPLHSESSGGHDRDSS